MRSFAAAIGLTLLLVAFPLTTAQDTDPVVAPPFSPTVNVLYAHSVSGSTDHTMDTLAVRTDNNPGVSQLVNDDFTWTMTLTPPLQQTVVLDTSKTIDITVYLGGSQSVGRVAVTTKLSLGSEAVASGASKDLNIAPSGASPAPVNKYGTVTWQAPVDVATLSPGQPLVWTVTATGSASAVFMGMSDARGRSAITLPIVSASDAAAVPATVYHDLNGTTASITLAGDGTNATHQYNWMAPTGPLLLDVSDATYAAGTARVRVRDAGNTTLANVTFNGTAAQMQVEGVAGNWSLLVDLASYEGNLTVSLAPKPAGGPAGGGSGSGSSTRSGSAGTGGGASSGSTTGNATKDGGKGAPAPAGVAVAAGLLAVAALVRRRRA